ncbi:hypothetical protein BD324DRAFT_648124 [Kockovaella imperatae]|uniref:tRNA-dihydrouridine(16/17) synthase [NAD(P)(+)] n=1 Tax=Kockovaella imperatae TaxID=4999 RepID=A0A1Y1UUI8_9TREE|nr:hypothetical protein BD324DRAFT_648124 [Kockovaella imperatae]ORX41244.1 hypothetical protein BD324DRAFT_648124 [Kockovaella imperatae]
MSEAVAGPSKRKLEGYDFYRSIGSPKFVVAPMVDQSELAWRLLSKAPLPPAMAGPSIPATAEVPHTRHQGGAHLTYTPMIHAGVFARSVRESKGGDGQFDLTFGEEGSSDTLAGIEGGDRPLFVQFCANDPEVLLAAAKMVEKHCDAVDINFGCPQGIARRGGYGAFLQDDWELIRKLISTLHENLSVPVTAKFRIFPDLERTLAYAKMMQDAGAQILTCHGRTREMKGQHTGLADWKIIKAVKEHLTIPVFANGNILYREDVDRCLEETGCDGVMTAEGNLSNPAIFLPPDHPHFHPSVITLANRYIDIVESLSTQTALSAIRAHMFRLFRHVLDEDDGTIRDMILRAKAPYGQPLEDFREIIRAFEEKLKDAKAAAGPDWKAEPLDSATGYRKLPSFAAQPLLRAIPESSEVGGNEELVAGELRARSTSPLPNMPVHCVWTGPNPCHGVAASRCPTGACIIHCRMIRAIEDGMDPQTASDLSARGELAGRGCEAHEAKVLAKKALKQQKKKVKAEAKESMRFRKAEAKRKRVIARERQS